MKRSLAPPDSGEHSGQAVEQSRPAAPRVARQRRDADGARADSELHVLCAGVSASYGRGRKRKSALQWPSQQQRRLRPSPATRPGPAQLPRQRRGGTRSPSPPSRAASPGAQQSDGAAAAAALRRGRPALGIPARAGKGGGRAGAPASPGRGWGRGSLPLLLPTPRAPAWTLPAARRPAPVFPFYFPPRPITPFPSSRFFTFPPASRSTIPVLGSPRSNNPKKSSLQSPSYCIDLGASV